MSFESIVIARRFRGPPESGNGGYVCGRLAALVEGPAEIALKAPPPLNVPLQAEREAGGIRLLHGTRVIATARPAQSALAAPPPAPSRRDVEQAAPFYDGFKEHFLPGCFVCGPERTAGDGMRIFAAPVDGREMVAALWAPREDLAHDGRTIAPEFVWSALDCPGYFALRRPGLFALLGRLSGAVVRVPDLGEPCMVAGWQAGADGRKLYAGTAVYGADGEPIAQALAAWVELRPEARGKVS